jgi:hypothetical protein
MKKREAKRKRRLLKRYKYKILKEFNVKSELTIHLLKIYSREMKQI